MSKAGNFSLDFFLSTLLQSREFQSLPHKDWQLISVLVPGTTPAECESRFNELNQELKLASDLKLENQVNESRNAAENVISIPSSRNATSASSASSAGTISAHPAADESASSKPSSRESHSKPVSNFWKICCRNLSLKLSRTRVQYLGNCGYLSYSVNN